MVRNLKINLYTGYSLFGWAQVFKIGLHIGHLFKKSRFLARWFLEGIGNFSIFLETAVKKVVKSFYNFKQLKVEVIKKIGDRKAIYKKTLLPIFVIKFSKILLGIRSLIDVAKMFGRVWSRGWFICHNHIFMPFTIRYALILGMGYSVFDWVAGCLTNFKNIFTLFYLLYREFLNGLLLEKKHYIFLFRLLGFSLTGFWVPSFLFLPRLLESQIVSYEGGCVFAQSIAVVDSNVLTGDTLLPLPGNDDSLLSINFFFYIFSWYMLKHNTIFFKKWYTNIRKYSRRKIFFTLYYLTFFYRFDNYLFWRSKFKELFLNMHQEAFLFFDEKAITDYLTPYGTISFGLGVDYSDLLTMERFFATNTLEK